MTGWRANGRDLEFVPPDVGGSVRIGAVELAWVEKLSPNSAEGCIHFAIGNSNYAPYGTFGASRTSDGGGIGGMSIGYQDSKVPGSGAWAHYFEAHVAADAHKTNTAFGYEVAVVNRRKEEPCADSTPRFPNQPGVIDGARFGVGKPGDNGQEISTLAVFINAEGTETAKARKGLVFHEWAIKFYDWLHTTIAEAISFARGHSIRWYDSFGRPATTISCHVDHAEYAPHLDFTNGAVHFIGKHGQAQFSFNTETGVPYYGILAHEPTPPTGQPVGKLKIFIGGQPFYLPIYKN